MGELIGQIFFEIVAFYTGRSIVFAASLGKIRVRPPPFVPPKRWLGEPMVTRLPNGRLSVSVDAAALVGLLFWLTVIIVAWLCFGTSLCEGVA